jgi:hypothetical protein
MARDKQKGDVQEKNIEVPYHKSELQDIDMAVYKLFKERLDISTKTNKGFASVPVIWAGQERSNNIKRDDIKRDKKGNVIYPVIVVERTNIVKDLQNAKSIPYAAIDPRGDLKGGLLEINRVIKQDKTSNFLKADTMRTRSQEMLPDMRGKENKKVVYETLSIPIPIYMNIDYKIVIRTEYQEQMNDILTPIIRASHGHRRIMIGHNNNNYEAFVDDNYSSSNNITNYETNERKYETAISMKVLGYLIGDGRNQQQPRVVRRENPVKVRLLRERVMVGDIEDVF